MLRIVHQNRVLRHLGAGAGRRRNHNRRKPRIFIETLIKNLIVGDLIRRQKSDRLAGIHGRTAADADHEVGLLFAKKSNSFPHGINRGILPCLIIDGVCASAGGESFRYIIKCAAGFGGMLTGYNQRLAAAGGQQISLRLYAAARKDIVGRIIIVNRNHRNVSFLNISRSDGSMAGNAIRS